MSSSRSGGMPVQQMKNLTHPKNWKLKANYPYPSVQIDGCPSKQYDRVVSYWFRRGSEQFDKLGLVKMIKSCPHCGPYNDRDVCLNNSFPTV